MLFEAFTKIVEESRLFFRGYATFSLVVGLRYGCLLMLLFGFD